jgi:TonB family protein
MSQELHKLLHERAQVEVLGWPVCLALSLALHAAVGAAVILAPKVRAGVDEPAKVTWVTLPAMAGDSSGGSSPTEAGETGERLRRVEDVAPQAQDGRKGAPTPEGFSTATKATGVKGTNPDPRSMGQARDFARGAQPQPNAVRGTAGQGGGGGIGQGSGIPGLRASGAAMGGIGSIDSVDGDFPFVWYLQQVQNRITTNWNRIPGSLGRVQIYFRIQRDGQIDGARVESPSGNGALDDSALRAVRSANPLTPLPESFEGKQLGVRFWFSCVN